MVALPSPRGFWDYALFALILAGLLMGLFWLEIGGGIGLADAGLALVTSMLGVFIVILARQSEKAKWVSRPTRRVHLLAAVGTCLFIFGALFADAYILHRREISARMFRDDLVPFGVAVTAVLLPTRKRNTALR